MKIIKIPLCAGNLKHKKGLEKGPNAVFSEVKSFFLKENGLLPFLEEKNVEIDNLDITSANESIYGSVELPCIMLGGDHSMTYSSFKAFSKKFKNPGIVVFDAHLDCENDFSPPTHEDYLRVLIEKGHVKKENVIVVGIRNMHINELDFAKRNKLKIFSMKELSHEGKMKVCDAVMAASKSFDGLYVSVDIDVLDPAFAPGTGYIEPGGMSTRQLIYFIQRLKNLKNIHAWDLVEVNPDLDVNKLTVITAAKLIVEMC